MDVETPRTLEDGSLRMDVDASKIHYNIYVETLRDVKQTVTSSSRVFQLEFKNPMRRFPVNVDSPSWERFSLAPVLL